MDREWAYCSTRQALFNGRVALSYGYSINICLHFRSHFGAPTRLALLLLEGFKFGLGQRLLSIDGLTVKNSLRQPAAPNIIYSIFLSSERWPSPDLYHILNVPQADLLSKHLNTEIRHTITLGSCFPSGLAAGVIEARRWTR